MLALLTSPGCVDLEENLVGVLTSSFYATPAGLDAAVNGTYAELRSFFGREESMGLSQLGTDTWTNGDQGAKKHFNRYDAAVNAADSWVRSPWQAFYRGINTANAVIDRAESIQGMDPNVKATRIAEARFLRALFYFQLVQMYGDLHLTLHENVGVQTEATRTPAADIYLAIIADLQAAIQALPARSDIGRATRGAAQHVLAKVYLTRAYKSFAVQGDFTRAADLARTVINSGQYSLVASFAALFCAPSSSTGYCNLNGFNENNSEVIFSVQFSYNTAQFDDENGNFLHLYFLSFYDDRAGMPRDLNNGRAFRRLRPTPYAINLWQRWSGTPGLSPILDTRYDASFQSVWYATVGANGQGGRRINPGDTALWHPGYEVTPEFRASKAYFIVTPSQYDEFRYPTLKKHQDNLRASVNEQDSGKDYPLARMAETYLIAAEALLGAGNVAEATTFINTVRRRAAGPGLASAMDVTPAQVNLDFILDERERELAGELHRWFDLVRTNKLVERVRLHNAQATGVQAFHALRPIPQAQIDLSSTRFPQNTGY